MFVNTYAQNHGKLFSVKCILFIMTRNAYDGDNQMKVAVVVMVVVVIYDNEDANDDENGNDDDNDDDNGDDGCSNGGEWQQWW